MHNNAPNYINDGSFDTGLHEMHTVISQAKNTFTIQLTLNTFPHAQNNVQPKL